MILCESGVLRLTKQVGLGFCKTCVIPTLNHLHGSNKKKLVLVRLEIHVYEWPFWRWRHRFDASRNTILRELLFVVTKRSYILKGEISKLILHIYISCLQHVYCSSCFLILNVFCIYGLLNHLWKWMPSSCWLLCK